MQDGEEYGRGEIDWSKLNTPASPNYFPQLEELRKQLNEIEAKRETRYVSLENFLGATPFEEIVDKPLAGWDRGLMGCGAMKKKAFTAPALCTRPWPHVGEDHLWKLQLAQREDAVARLEGPDKIIREEKDPYAI